MDKQKLTIVVGIGALVILGAFSSYAPNKQTREEQAVKDRVVARYHELIAGSEPDEARTQKALNYAFTDISTLNTITNEADRAKQPRPEQLALEHISTGAIARYPLSQNTLVELFSLSCSRNTQMVRANSNFDISHIEDAWRANNRAVADLRSLLDAQHSSKAETQCDDRFRRLVASFRDRRTPAQEAGEAVGMVKNKISDAWTSVTAPINKQIDDFKAGYESQ
ncbi:MAG: hypothetical protein ACK43M_11620 [Allorhizobium sp.]